MNALPRMKRDDYQMGETPKPDMGEVPEGHELKKDFSESIYDAANATVLFHHLDPLKKFLRDNALNEVCINRPGEVWTEGRAGWRRYEVPQCDFLWCERFGTLVGNANRKEISTVAPIMSASLPSGERTQVIFSPACPQKTVSITIRKPSFVDLSLDDLDNGGTFAEVQMVSNELTDGEKELLHLRETEQIKAFLQKAVLLKRNILLVGKTGSGKTTVIKSLIDVIPKDERLITIEDVHELPMRNHPNKVHLFYAREEEGGSRVTAKSALASCLRMKPDRIMLSELRGDEAWEFVKSVSTGHPGSISSMHANGAYEAFEQLTSFIKDSETGRHLDTDYIKHRLFTTLDVVLFFDRFKLREIYYEPERKRQKMG